MAKEVDYSKPLKSKSYEDFCQAYMITNNATQAAKDAKYSEKTAQQSGSRLLLNVVIQNRLAVLRDKLAQETGISIKMVAEGFKKIATGTLGKTLTNQHKIKAYENLGQHVGFYEKDNSQKKENLAEFLKAMKEG